MGISTAHNATGNSNYHTVTLAHVSTIALAKAITFRHADIGAIAFCRAITLAIAFTIAL